ncbi:alginate O-acetyltransferase AlgX-related protein [Phenylobacterium sp. VNQ135]|uniref:alginate O-acetyltransferase AlgX-related protein n=1 Tax=Phenylobacterium sp. VNQ135 TaxID=3400922 RepID=UPI003C08650F
MTETLRLTPAEILQHDIANEAAAALTPGVLKQGTAAPRQTAVAGLDGHLFVGLGTNNWEKQYAGRVNIDDAWFAAWAALLAKREAEAQRRGVTLCNLILPEKQVVMPEMRWRQPPSPDQRPLMQLLRRLPTGDSIYYAADDLIAAKTAAPIWARRNSHWTASGCLVTVGALAARLGVGADIETLRFACRRVRTTHDLPVHFFGDPPLVDALELLANGPYVFEHHARQTTGRNTGSAYGIHNPDAPDQRRLVIFGDSFSYEFGLGAALSALFAEVAFHWGKSIQWDRVEALRADIVISEAAERFLVTLPSA